MCVTKKKDIHKTDYRMVAAERGETKVHDKKAEASLETLRGLIAIR